jgi:hypothetical protein
MTCTAPSPARAATRRPGRHLAACGGVWADRVHAMPASAPSPWRFAPVSNPDPRPATAP